MDRVFIAAMLNLVVRPRLRGYFHRVLLRRDMVPPLVTVKDYSSLGPHVGNGVFVSGHLRGPILKGQAVCLYPGVYSPGIPPHVRSSALADTNKDHNMSTLDPNNSSIEYLGGRSPSTTTTVTDDFEDNAYLLNVNVDLGGYIDGQTALGDYESRHGYENPHACGHLINHQPNHKANVHVESFYWQTALQSLASDIADGEPFDYDEYYYSIPNQLRCDGTPWYRVKDRVIYYEPSALQATADHLFSQQGTKDNKIGCCVGAVMIAKRSIEPEEELFLDYQLPVAKKLPQWAEDWYE